MEKREKIIFDECISYLSQNSMSKIPFKNSDIRNKSMNDEILRDFIKRNFRSIKIKTNNRKRIIQRIGNEFGDNYGIQDNENETIITLPSEKTVNSSLIHINTIAELAQESIKPNNFYNIKGGVIPLYYEKNFIMENIREIGDDTKFWLYYNMYKEAYELSKGELDKNKLRRIYALLLSIQFKDDEFIDKDIITSSNSAEEELEKRGYVLTDHILKKLQ